MAYSVYYSLAHTTDRFVMTALDVALFLKLLQKMELKLSTIQNTFSLLLQLCALFTIPFQRSVAFKGGYFF